MQNRTKIQEIAEQRLAEAELLFQNGHYDGACYLVGYCVELALKAVICKTLDLEDLFTTNYRADLVRPFKTHDLDNLLVYAGLKNKLEIAIVSNSNLMSSWSTITNQALKWSEESRYKEIGTRTAQDTQKLIESVKTLLLWIKNYW